MPALNRRLPPASALAAFEAAARHGNFTRAAEEMGVTQAAISRQIRILEGNLGAALFHRLHRSVRLTQHGQEFYQAVGISLRHIARTADDIRAVSKGSYLTVMTTMVFATYWLMPRLSGFRAAHPGIDIHLVASDPYTESQRIVGDVSIRYADRDSVPPGARYLFGDEIFPVCSSGYLKDGACPRCVNDLLGENLLHLFEFRRPTLDWRAWFAEQGIDYVPPPGSEPFPNFTSLIEAARGGKGIALGWRHLVDELLERKVLVRPLDVSVTTNLGYYLLVPAGEGASSETANFVEWVLSEAQGVMEI